MAKFTRRGGQAVVRCMEALNSWLDENDEERRMPDYNPVLDDVASEAMNAIWYLEEFTRLLAAIDSEGR